MIDREASKEILSLTKSFRVTVVSGPRQSGKTTLLRNVFKDYAYYNLEDLNTFDTVKADPMGFVRNNPMTIVDEVQRFPELLSAIQVVVDERGQTGDYILSGSQNLLISEKISQSLAGRAAYHTLLPLSLQELRNASLMSEDYTQQIWKGFYPAIYSSNMDPTLYYQQYVSTYVERDVRAIKNIQDLGLFRKFMTLLAGRVGQLVNYESLANDTGVSSATVEQWMTVLEASYIIYRLKPYHANIGKRLIKSPKIYFTDTGLACYLLGVNDPNIISTYHLRGGLFENLVIMDIYKRLINHGLGGSGLYFYRDSNDNEVDLVIDRGIDGLLPIEIKSSSRPAPSFASGILNFRDALGLQDDAGLVIYSGSETPVIKNIKYTSWQNIEL